VSVPRLPSSFRRSGAISEARLASRRPRCSELVEVARRGNLDAYGQLVTRYQDQALAAAYVILNDRQEAEDATHEAFTRALGALGGFRPGGLASDGADLTHASALVLDLLHTAVTDRAEDDRTLADAINSAAVPLGDAERSELESLFRQLRTFNYRAYSPGYKVAQSGANLVQVAVERAR
jgi:DNA-directed RNA polymerase specialized sigma24 family protein